MNTDATKSEQVQAPADLLPLETNEDFIWDTDGNAIAQVTRGLFGERVQRAAYLAHAANCYPVLLASLAELVNSPNAKSNACWDRARAALAQAQGGSK